MAVPATPLKDFDESRIAYVLRLLMLRIQAHGQDPARSALGDAGYGVKLAIGFGEGLFEGARTQYRAMIEDFRRDYAALVKLAGPELASAVGVGLAVSFDEFFMRPLFETVPTGLSPRAAAAAERLIEMFDAMTLLQTIGLIDEVAKAGRFFDMLGVGVDDLFEALSIGGQNWAIAVGREPDAERQGRMLGAPVGMIVFEVVRAIIEPPPLDAAHLISAFALTPAEQKTLGL